MDDLANELSCTMIDVDSEKSASGRTSTNPTPSNQLDPLAIRREGICGGEASAEGDGGCHESNKYREKVPLKKEERERQAKEQQTTALENDAICDLMSATCPRITRGSNRPTKPVARSASILLRSKGLILSDSESEEEENSQPGSGMPTVAF